MQPHSVVVYFFLVMFTFVNVNCQWNTNEENISPESESIVLGIPYVICHICILLTNLVQSENSFFWPDPGTNEWRWQSAIPRSANINATFPSITCASPANIACSRANFVENLATITSNKFVVLSIFFFHIFHIA